MDSSISSTIIKTFFKLMDYALSTFWSCFVMTAVKYSCHTYKFICTFSSNNTSAGSLFLHYFFQSPATSIFFSPLTFKCFYHNKPFWFGIFSGKSKRLPLNHLFDFATAPYFFLCNIQLWNPINIFLHILYIFIWCILWINIRWIQYYYLHPFCPNRFQCSRQTSCLIRCLANERFNL